MDREDQKSLTILSTEFRLFTAELRGFMQDQAEHNRTHYDTRTRVDRVEVRANTMAAIGVALSGIIATVAAFFKHG